MCIRKMGFKTALITIQTKKTRRPIYCCPLPLSTATIAPLPHAARSTAASLVEDHIPGEVLVVHAAGAAGMTFCVLVVPQKNDEEGGAHRRRSKEATTTGREQASRKQRERRRRPPSRNSVRWRLNEKDRIPRESRKRLTRVFFDQSSYAKWIEASGSRVVSVWRAHNAPSNLGSASALVIFLSAVYTAYTHLKATEWAEQSVSKQSV